MEVINYIRGDATQPAGDGNRIIVHVCNDMAHTPPSDMIGQRNIKTAGSGIPPVRYEAIAAALSKVAVFAAEKKATVHMPHIGCGLAGGAWDKMEPIIAAELTGKNIPVTVYDF